MRFGLSVEDDDVVTDRGSRVDGDLGILADGVALGPFVGDWD